MFRRIESQSFRRERERSKWLRLILKVIGVALLLNAVSFVLLVRIWPENRKAELVPAREDAQSTVVNYLIAGTLNQAEAVFEQFLPEFEGSVVYVNFAMFGWDPEMTAIQIAEDITERQAEARIWAISVGCQVAHLVDAKVDGVKIVAINPCVTAECLAPQYQGWNWLAHGLRGVVDAFGWISACPFVPAAGSDTDTDVGRQGYSLILLMDQLVATTGGTDLPGPYQAELVIVSSQDQLLDVAAEKALYAESAEQILEIEADHAGTTVYAEAYREAFRASGLMK